MKEILVLLSLLGNLHVTSYRSVPSQTDSSPFVTSTDERVRAGGCAISRDLLCGACRKLHHRCKHPDNPTKLHYGDWLYIEGYGYRQINDVMGLREHYRIKAKAGSKKLFHTIRMSLDIWVEKWSEEHTVNVKHLNVYKVKEKV